MHAMLEILNASYTVVMLLLFNKGKDVNFKEFHASVVREEYYGRV